MTDEGGESEGSLETQFTANLDSAIEFGLGCERRG